MKKYIFLFFAVCAFSVYANAQNRTGDCTSYTSDDRSVTFYLNDSSAIQLRLCSQSTVRIWFSPDGSFQRNNPSFAVVNEDLEDVGTVHVDEQNACYEIFTPKLRIRVNKSPFNLQIFDKYQKLLFSDYADKGHISNGQRKLEYKTLRRDEHFFGLGEKTGKLDRRGEAYKMWNSDKPCYSTVEDPLYKSIPFFMSSYRYGIFLDNTYKTEFKFGTESRDYYSFEAPGGEMIYYFIFGKDYKEIMKQYVDLTGKPIMPPKWALGFAQCRGLLTSEKLSYEIAEGYRKRGIPCDVIYQDIGWTQYLQDFEWRKGNYENPKKMLADLKDMGFKVVVSQDPVISQANKRQWEEADRLGYLVKDSTNGRSYDMPWPWGGNCGVVDFTLPAVADWWGAYQQKPIDDGIAGFWTDMGEPAWSNEEQTERLVMKHHLGMHDEIHNVYGLTWDKVVKEQFEKRNPNRRVFQMTRAAFAPPYSLFDNVDYKSLGNDYQSSTYQSELQKKYKWVEYHKWKFKSKTYTALTGKNKCPVLMTRVEFGIVGSYNQYKPSPFETFYVGGDGTSGYSSNYATETIGLRGYSNGSLTPNGYTGYAYDRFTLELRYPLMLQTSTNIYALAFVEGGNAWNSVKKFNPFDMKRSAGVGVRIFLPMVGLMGIDWAYGFDKVFGTKGGNNFHFILGQEF